MNIPNSLKPLTYFDLAYEALFRFRSIPHAAPLSWKIPPGSLKVYWPTYYSWTQAKKWLAPIQEGLSRHAALAFREIPQPPDTVVRFEIETAAGITPVYLDYSDYPSIQNDLAESGVPYFKMQHQEAGYPFSNVQPGGYITNDIGVYRYLPGLRSAKDNATAKYDVYGRFGMDFAQGIRKQALSLLNAQKQFHYEGSAKRIRYSRFLKEVARSRVCINLPGNGEFCFRLFDYMAVGACIVGPKPKNRLHIPLEDKKHLAYCRDDLSDLVDICQYYLEHENEREKLTKNSREYFDRYVHFEQLAAYYLSTSLKAPA